MKQRPLPWWTAVVPFALLALCTLLSLPLSTNHGIYWIYFPINLGIVLALWWGPRVLFAVFLNGLLAAPILNLPDPSLYPVYAFPETFEVFLAWLLVSERFKHYSSWRPTPKNIALFFVYGLFIPSIICSTLIQTILLFKGLTTQDTFWSSTILTMVGDLTGAVFITLPLFILATPWMLRKGLSRRVHSSLPPVRIEKMTKKEYITMGAVLLACVAVGYTLPLSSSWYLFGIILLVYSAWYGLYAAVLMNTWIMAITISFPYLFKLPWMNDEIQIQTPATLLTLCFCSLVTGSAITSLIEKVSRLKKTENDLMRAKQLAEEASEAKSEFLARMSHEIRTPLNSVLGMLELLKETQLSKDQARYLTLFSHAGENLKALINDLLDFSKIEAKALDVEQVSYNLHDTVRSVFEILQIKAEEKGLEFSLDIHDNVPLYQWGDPTRLRQVLFNLIGNALKFTHEGSVKVVIEVAPKGNQDRLLFSISDTGIGIPRHKQADLFSPFFQADPGTARKYGGSGLGLVISKNLVEIMGGEMDVKSLAGRGTTFKIYLPHRPDYSAQTEVKTTPAFSWKDEFPNRRFKVLLVDDSEDNRVLMIHYLKNLPFDCDEAINGQEAVRMFKESRYDIVFMDIQMPIMTGYKATELIRIWEKDQNLPHTPIIALTATAVVQDLQRTLSSGCDAYAVKPVKKNEIIEILRKTLYKDKRTVRRDEPPTATFYH